MDRCGVGTCNTVRVQWNVSNRLGVEEHLLNYRRPGGGYFRNFWVGMRRWDPGTLQPTDQFPEKWYPILDPNVLIYIPYPRGNCMKTIPSQRHIPILPIYGSTPPPGTGASHLFP